MISNINGNLINFPSLKFLIYVSKEILFQQQLLKFSYAFFPQVFAYTKRQQVMSDDNCLDAASPEGPVKLVRCHGMGGNQAWVFSDDVSSRIYSQFPEDFYLLVLYKNMSEFFLSP